MTERGNLPTPEWGGQLKWLKERVLDIAPQLSFPNVELLPDDLKRQWNLTNEYYKNNEMLQQSKAMYKAEFPDKEEPSDIVICSYVVKLVLEMILENYDVPDFI